MAAVKGTQDSTKTNMLHLPAELWDAILSGLSPSDILSLMLVSRAFHASVEKYYCWRKLALSEPLTRHDSLFRRLKTSGCSLQSLEMDFGTHFLSPSTLDSLVKNCSNLVDVKVIALVRCQDNDLMTPLSKLEKLKKIRVTANVEAFAPSFTCRALRRWTDLEVFECEQSMADPKKNHNLNYEFIDLPLIVSVLAERHGKTLRSLKFHIPIRLRPVNSLTEDSLNLIGENMGSLESLWLNPCPWSEWTIFSLRRLTNLRQLSIGMNESVDSNWFPEFYGLLFEQHELAFPRLRQFRGLFRGSAKDKSIKNIENKDLSKVYAKKTLGLGDKLKMVYTVFPSKFVIH